MANRQRHSGDGLEQGGFKTWRNSTNPSLAKGDWVGKGKRVFIHLGLQPEIGGLYIGVVHEFLVGAFQNGASIFKNMTVVDDRQNGAGVLF